MYTIGDILALKKDYDVFVKKCGYILNKIQRYIYGYDGEDEFHSFETHAEYIKVSDITDGRITLMWPKGKADYDGDIEVEHAKGSFPVYLLELSGADLDEAINLENEKYKVEVKIRSDKEALRRREASLRAMHETAKQFGYKVEKA